MGKILKYWPKEEIIKALQQLPKDVLINRKNLDIYNKKGLICNSTVMSRKFGSIKEACKQAGVRCDALYGKEHMKHIAKLNTKWNKEKIIICLKQIYKENKNVQPKDLDSYSRQRKICSNNIIRKHFGTYKQLFEEANIPYKH